MKKAIVTGSHGFIGKHLIKALKERNIHVFPIPHKELYDEKNLENKLKEINPDYIFHLAAYGNMANHYDEEEIFHANIIILWNLLQATKELSYEAFINVSSSSVTLPHETIYSATKAAGERLCRAFVDEYSKPIVSVRPFSVYGPGEASFRFIPTVFRSCMMQENMNLDPNPIHDWVYVEEFANALIAYAEAIELFIGENVNYGTGRGTSNKAVVALIEEITGQKAHIKIKENMRPFDNRQWYAQDKQASVLLREGLQKYYESINNR